MTISYPLTLPSVGYAAVRWVQRSVVAVGESPLTLTQQVQQHQGQRWEADLVLPPLQRADAEAWLGILLALKGRYGTFLLGDPLGRSPRGTWAGTPLVNGAHSANASSVALDGLTAGATVKAGDWLQFGSGSSSRLHKVLVDATANGSGQVTLDLYPTLREALADNAAVTTSNTQGVFRLGSNELAWDLQTAQLYGLRFSAVEAL